MRPAESEDIS